jgi:hypothetical protein
MPFVSIFEQVILEQKQQVQAQEQQIRANEQQIRANEQQIRDNCLKGIALGLKLKFQAAGEALFTEVQKQTDPNWLQRFLGSIESADSVEDLRKLLL